MIRALIILLALTVSACGANPLPTLTPAQLAQWEAYNATVVEMAAAGCDQTENVYPVGSQEWDLAEDFTEEASATTVELVERCMANNIVVVQAAIDQGLSEAIVLSPFGDYTYTPDFLAGKTDAEMIVIDRGLLETIQRLQAKES